MSAILQDPTPPKPASAWRWPQFWIGFLLMVAVLTIGKRHEAVQALIEGAFAEPLHGRIVVAFLFVGGGLAVVLYGGAATRICLAMAAAGFNPRHPDWPRRGAFAAGVLAGLLISLPPEMLIEAGREQVEGVFSVFSGPTLFTDMRTVQ